MEAEEKQTIKELYTFKKLRPFEYNSREAYKRYNTAGEYWVMIALVISIISIISLIIFAILGASKYNTLAMIGGVIAPFIGLGVLMLALWLGVSEYSVGDFIDECIVRYKMWKHSNYIPIEAKAMSELNSVVKMKNGELFRKYQFINAEKSGTNYITLQVPKNIIFDTYTVKGTPSSEKMCMFNRLSEMELMDILIPIKQYYEDKQYREEMERKETEIKAQSEANSRITTEDIHNLPLFKSMQSLADKTEEDVKKYHKETQSHLKDNQDIVDKVNETIKDKK